MRVDMYTVYMYSWCPLLMHSSYAMGSQKIDCCSCRKHKEGVNKTKYVFAKLSKKDYISNKNAKIIGTSTHIELLKKSSRSLVLSSMWINTFVCVSSYPGCIPGVLWARPDIHVLYHAAVRMYGAYSM